MPSNNPAGTNSPVAFDRFTRQIPYGEKKVQGDLQRSAPVAGGSAASTPLNLPKAAQRAATRPRAAPQPDRGPLPQPPQQVPPPSASNVWQTLTAIPGITPLAFEYAQRAAT